MYSKRLTLTVNGANVDKLVVTATGCKNVALSTSGTYVSSASTAFFQCTVSAVGPAQFALKRSSDAVTSTVSFNVPMPQVTMFFSNNAGINSSLVVTLAPDKTPITVDNFLKYVNAGFYNSTRIHVVTSSFIQGGAYGEKISGDATFANIPGIKPLNDGSIALEFNNGLSNLQWTIGMAESNQSLKAPSQFYFNLVSNPSFDARLAVFGSVTTGTNTVAPIANPALAPCVAITLFSNQGECTPIPNVVLTSATQTQ